MGTASGKANYKMDSGYIRRAKHAGSWYSSDRTELDGTLSSFLEEAASESSTEDLDTPLRAVICPHAGYSYSGLTAAYSYHHLRSELQKVDSPIKRILLLHPSHHVYLNGCAVSGASRIETPLGNLQIDEELRDEILNLNPRGFSIMEKSVDELEHSGEMQYPYIAKACGKKNIKVLPIMCGNISGRQEEDYGRLLAPIVGRQDVLCVVSTDFCHWGSRFQYQPTPNTTSIEIHEHIRQLDARGIRHICLQEPRAFAKYLTETRNTICGRHAISVWLNAVHCNKPEQEVLDIQFVKYAQSSHVRAMRESSVSYGSATARRKI